MYLISFLAKSEALLISLTTLRYGVHYMSCSLPGFLVMWSKRRRDQLSVKMFVINAFMRRICLSINFCNGQHTMLHG